MLSMCVIAYALNALFTFHTEIYLQDIDLAKARAKLGSHSEPCIMYTVSSFRAALHTIILNHLDKYSRTYLFLNISNTNQFKVAVQYSSRDVFLEIMLSQATMLNTIDHAATFRESRSTGMCTAAFHSHDSKMRCSGDDVKTNLRSEFLSIASA